MSIVLTTTIDITATPEQAWNVLTDFAHYGEWSNFSSITGEPTLGAKLKMRMPGFWFTSRVTQLEVNHRLQWSASLITPGLFLGAHTFTLENLGDGTTRLINTETFTGGLTRPFENVFEQNGSAGGYAAFNRALKSRVEARAARSHSLA